MQNTKTKENHDLNQSLGFLINVAARSMRLALEEGLKCHEITPTQWILLRGLRENNEINQSLLGSKLFLDNATITRQIDKLEQMDLLRRKPSEDDRRAHIISMTAKGKRLLQKIDTIANSINDDALAGINKREVQLVINGLGTIQSNLEKTINNNR